MDKTLKDDCPCTRLKCPRHGDCKACREHHLKKSLKYPPACEKVKNRK